MKLKDLQKRFEPRPEPVDTTPFVPKRWCTYCRQDTNVHRKHNLNWSDRITDRVQVEERCHKCNNLFLSPRSMACQHCGTMITLHDGDVYVTCANGHVTNTPWLGSMEPHEEMERLLAGLCPDCGAKCNEWEYLTRTCGKGGIPVRTKAYLSAERQCNLHKGSATYDPVRTDVDPDRVDALAKLVSMTGVDAEVARMALASMAKGAPSITLPPGGKLDWPSGETLALGPRMHVGVDMGIDGTDSTGAYVMKPAIGTAGGHTREFVSAGGYAVVEARVPGVPRAKAGFTIHEDMPEPEPDPLPTTAWELMAGINKIGDDFIGGKMDPVCRNHVLIGIQTYLERCFGYRAYERVRVQVDPHEVMELLVVTLYDKRSGKPFHDAASIWATLRSPY